MRRLTTLILLGLSLAGCAKNKEYAPSAAPGGYADADYAAGGSGGDYMEMAKSAPEREYEAADEAYGPPAPPSPVIAAPTTTTPADPSASTGTGKTTEENRNDIGGRLIIYTAGMRIAVFNLEQAMEKAEAIPEKFGGYVHSMTTGELVLKIPARKLRPAMAELSTFGVVEQRSLSTQDVSAEYTDIDSRIRALEGTHKQLLELLSKARTVDEALHVRQALDQVGAELEVLKGRMRQLDSLIAFSTLTLSMYERGPHTPTPSSNDPFPWVDALGVEATEWN